jgi:hypothetical protein
LSFRSIFRRIVIYPLLAAGVDFFSLASFLHAFSMHSEK